MDIRRKLRLMFLPWLVIGDLRREVRGAEKIASTQYANGLRQGRYDAIAPGLGVVCTYCNAWCMVPEAQHRKGCHIVEKGW